jgi:cytochrome c peroxidase
MKKFAWFCLSAGWIVFANATAGAGTLTPEQQLGEALYFDQSLSANGNQACASCHTPASGFADPRNTGDPADSPVSPGSDPAQFGTRNAPSAAYARFSPAFHWDGAEGLYVGGQFWDGRDLNLAGQAARPPLNPVEMALPDKEAVVARLAANPDYPGAFQDVYGIDLNEANATHAGVLAAYDRMTQAIGAFEKTSTFAPFSSKFDYWLVGRYRMTRAERQGMKLFNGKAKCSGCHLSEPQLAADGKGIIPPLFTDFTYDNLGIPVNPRIAQLHGGPVALDYGLGGRPDIAAADPLVLDNGDVVSTAQAGKFKVMSLRNIALTAPYGHNGFFATLGEIVHFYNTRDVLADCATQAEPKVGVNCWPAPEVARNVNRDELGNLHLSRRQEAELVAFMNTLTDGYGKPLDIALPPAP